MAHTFEITIDSSPPHALEHVKSVITTAGGSFEGNMDKGFFSGYTPLGEIRGEYRFVSADRVSVTILHKPFLLPYGAIESEMRKYFT